MRKYDKRLLQGQWMITLKLKPYAFINTLRFHSIRCSISLLWLQIWKAAGVALVWGKEQYPLEFPCDSTGQDSLLTDMYSAQKRS